MLYLNECVALCIYDVSLTGRVFTNFFQPETLTCLVIQVPRIRNYEVFIIRAWEKHQLLRLRNLRR